MISSPSWTGQQRRPDLGEQRGRARSGEQFPGLGLQGGLPGGEFRIGRR